MLKWFILAVLTSQLAATNFGSSPDFLLSHRQRPELLAQPQGPYAEWTKAAMY